MSNSQSVIRFAISDCKECKSRNICKFSDERADKMSEITTNIMAVLSKCPEWLGVTSGAITLKCSDYSVDRSIVAKCCECKHSRELTNEERKSKKYKNNATYVCQRHTYGFSKNLIAYSCYEARAE